MIVQFIVPILVISYQVIEKSQAIVQVILGRYLE